MKKLDISGLRFGRLVAILPAPGKSKWSCICDCGKTKITSLSGLKSGKCKSCGCLHSEGLIMRNIKHGYADTPTYRTWQSMRKRCRIKSNPQYADYGGRGIDHCDEWLDFGVFLKDMGVRPNGMTLERKDNEKGYDQKNCKWATQSEQQRNKRSSVKITVGEETLILNDWASRICTKYGHVVAKRIKSGYSPEIACTVPIGMLTRSMK